MGISLFYFLSVNNDYYNSSTSTAAATTTSPTKITRPATRNNGEANSSSSVSLFSAPWYVSLFSGSLYASFFSLPRVKLHLTMAASTPTASITSSMTRSKTIHNEYETSCFDSYNPRRYFMLKRSLSSQSSICPIPISDGKGNKRRKTLYFTYSYPSPFQFQLRTISASSSLSPLLLSPSAASSFLSRHNLPVLTNENHDDIHFLSSRRKDQPSVQWNMIDSDTNSFNDHDHETKKFDNKDDDSERYNDLLLPSNGNNDRNLVNLSFQSESEEELVNSNESEKKNTEVIQDTEEEEMEEEILLNSDDGIEIDPDSESSSSPDKISPSESPPPSIPRRHSSSASGSSSHSRVVDVKKAGEMGMRKQFNYQSVFKLKVSKCHPWYSRPWVRLPQEPSTSTAWAYDKKNKYVLTNNHCVDDAVSVQVYKRGVPKPYNADVLCRAPELDLALLRVDDDQFWENIEPIPLETSSTYMGDAVSVVGYPTGGRICVTSGVVSRVDYRNTNAFLTIQIDAAINPGNSGGPVLNEEGNCVGIAFSKNISKRLENIGYIIPVEVIKHFMKHYESNQKYLGVCSRGFDFQLLENDAVRKHLGLDDPLPIKQINTAPSSPDDIVKSLQQEGDKKINDAKNEIQTEVENSSQQQLGPPYSGIRVTYIPVWGSCYGILQEGDIILELDGHRIENAGTIKFHDGEYIMLDYLFTQKMVGDVMKVKLVRNNEIIFVEYPLEARKYLIPSKPDHLKYLIVGGLVFLPMSSNVVNRKSICNELRSTCYRPHRDSVDEEMVILQDILTHKSNLGYKAQPVSQLKTFNNIPIKNIDHLIDLVENCTDQWMNFEFDNNMQKNIFFETEEARIATKEVMEQNFIPSYRALTVEENEKGTKLLTWTKPSSSAKDDTKETKETKKQ